jgi:cobalt-zinc-cadmium efflux system outer membrane protein
MAEPECSATVTRGDVARCAIRASLVVRAELQTGEAVEGRRVAVSPLLPSNPVVSVTGGRRDADVGSATNWSATLSQELSIGGQRGARRRAAELEGEAQTHRVNGARRDAAASAWVAYFEALAGDDEVRLATKLATSATQIALVARGMADRGLLSPVEADVADATRVGIEQVQLAAERRARGGKLTLATLLGFDAEGAVVVEGELVALRAVEEEARAALSGDGRDRPEVRALDAERRAQEATATAFSRARIPNPTLSLYVQNDGFNERVLGGGISVPIPLPQPLGRFFNGEIAEANALASRAATQTERVRRQARLELLSAFAEYDMRKRQREAFTDERISRAEQGIDAITREIQAGRLPIRDALVSQQALVNLLRAGLEARLALCVASVDLARAAGVPLDRGTR